MFYRNIAMIALKYGCFHTNPGSMVKPDEFSLLALYQADGYPESDGN
jgi:hypothetical protein